MDSARKKLIDKIDKKLAWKLVLNDEQVEGIADFILRDRKRIIAPLLEDCPKELNFDEKCDWVCKQIKEAVRNAGLE